MNQIMEGVTEYAEGLDVRLSVTKGRLVVDAKNEGGYNGTDVDLVQLLEWVSKNMPELQPAHKWVGLTDEEIEAIWRDVEVSDIYDCVLPLSRSIERALKEKNT
jgi:hypothetical protein